MDIQKQKITVNDFNLLKVIGKGTYAKVVTVRKKDNQQIYAMKILKKKHIEKKKQEDHTKTEKEILCSTDHPFIIKMYYSFQNEKKLYYILEFCQGGELFNLLAQRRQLSEDVTRFYAAQMVLAIEHLHKSDTIYRDLKPENVLIDSDGYIRITDFGLSRRNVKEQDAMSFCGTPEYLAPEVLNKVGHGKPVDWWTLGQIIYELVTGYPPFYCNNRKELFNKIKNDEIKPPNNLTPRLKDLLKCLLEKDVEKRLGSIEGAAEIKKHPWFLKVDWTALYNKNVKPPFIPKIKGEQDVGNFDSEFTEMDLESYTSENSLTVRHYESFSYGCEDTINEGMDLEDEIYVQNQIENLKIESQNSENLFKNKNNNNLFMGGGSPDHIKTNMKNEILQQQQFVEIKNN